MSAPVRIQRQRTKGWRMPENTVYVGRPSWWGNPFSAEAATQAGYADGQSMAAYAFERWLAGDSAWSPDKHALDREFLLSNISALRGKNLACWCALNRPCHADVLLKLANAPTCDEPAPPLFAPLAAE